MRYLGCNVCKTCGIITDMLCNGSCIICTEWYLEIVAKNSYDDSYLDVCDRCSGCSGCSGCTKV